MPVVLKKYNLDLVHFPHAYIPLLYPGKFVVTTHDLTKINFKEKAATTQKLPVYLVKHLAFSFTFKQALTRAAKIITPSNYVKDELVKKLNIKKNKIVVTYEGADGFVDSDYQVSEGRVKEIYARFGFHDPYLIYVGNAYPHKNLGRLFEGLAKVDPAVKLVCVVKRDVFLERILQLAENVGIRSRLVLTGGVSDEDLKILLSRAEALVFPSLSEGFGLPGLEAMAVGCPVISSNASCLPEIYGDAAVYFDPYSTVEMAKKISVVLSDKKLRSDLIKKGKEQVKRYSWKTMAEETLAVYKDSASN